MGMLDVKQVVEIAHALEQCEHRFLCSLKQPPSKDKIETSRYESLNNLLPEGFLDRTKEIGKVIGWSPQVAVLSHPAVGGFVSHCGRNSTLESLWYGVPMAVRPLYSEQHIIAFQMVKELGLACKMKLDYRTENSVILSAFEIGKRIKQMMDDVTEIREKVIAMSENSRMAVAEGGSSSDALGKFIEEVLNISS